MTSQGEDGDPGEKVTDGTHAHGLGGKELHKRVERAEQVPVELAFTNQRIYCRETVERQEPDGVCQQPQAIEESDLRKGPAGQGWEALQDHPDKRESAALIND